VSSPAPPAIADGAVLERARGGDPEATRAIMQEHNRMLWRIARGILHDDADAEDVVQDAYVRALTSLDRFRGDSSLGTWLARIVVNEALRRRGRKPRTSDLADVVETMPAGHPGSATMAQTPGPEAATAARQVCRMVESAMDALPTPFRVVFMMRVIEQMSIGETAATLGITVATAKTRLHRANQQMRARLGADLAALLEGAFPFGGVHCERLTEGVLQRLSAGSGPIGFAEQKKGNIMSAPIRIGLAAIAALALGAAAGMSPALAQGGGAPNDAQIAHIAYTADNLDIKNAELALQRSTNKDVRAFANDMVRDHKAVNEKALALVKKLGVTPEDNATSQALAKQQGDELTKLSALHGAAFDKAYVANEVAYHKAVNSALQTTLIPSAHNPELKSLLQTGLGIFRGHEVHAEQLAGKLR
jgi:putative membrane protein